MVTIPAIRILNYLLNSFHAQRRPSDELMLLWLDDVRNPAEYGADEFVWVKSADEAICALKAGVVQFASLDHDVIGEKTGYDVICWMEENGAWPSRGVRVHSMNPVGYQKMQAVVDQHYEPQVTNWLKMDRLCGGCIWTGFPPSN